MQVCLLYPFDPIFQGKVSNPASELDGVASEHEAAVRDKAKEVGDGDSNDGVDDDDELVLSRAGCFIWLTIVTCCIAVLSDWILDAIEVGGHLISLYLLILLKTAPSSQAAKELEPLLSLHQYCSAYKIYLQSER